MNETQLNPMPVLFLGHGSPMHVLAEDAITESWQYLGQTLPKPKAILCISAHWLTQGQTSLTGSRNLEPIYDFYGFPDKLYQLKYPAQGSSELLEILQNKSLGISFSVDSTRGLDHGAWCVLYHLYPNANIPIVQMSIDYSKPAQFHFELGKKLRFLREQGFLILCSGNIIHNLEIMNPNLNFAYAWAREFDGIVQDLIERRDFQALLEIKNLSGGNLAIPTPDHYYPFLYALGAVQERDEIHFPVTGIVHGSISMLSLLIQTKS
jgi:4,5-DOPA dioxygenase extradiol